MTCFNVSINFSTVRHKKPNHISWIYIFLFSFSIYVFVLFIYLNNKPYYQLFDSVLLFLDNNLCNIIALLYH